MRDRLIARLARWTTAEAKQQLHDRAALEASAIARTVGMPMVTQEPLLVGAVLRCIRCATAVVSLDSPTLLLRCGCGMLVEHGEPNQASFEALMHIESVGAQQ